jgi:hypothetical protein
MDIKFLKDENDKLKNKCKTLDSQFMQYETKLHQSDLKLQESLYAQDDLKR